MNAVAETLYRHYAEFSDPITVVRQIDGRTLVETPRSAYWLSDIDDGQYAISERRLWVSRRPTVQPAITYTDPPPRFGSV